MRWLPAFVLIAATTAQAPADEPKGDLAKVQGKWTAMVGPDKDIPLRMEIKDKVATVVVTIQGEDRTLKGEIQLDETQKIKQWTWTKFKDFQGEDSADNPGIYKIDGDELTICSGGPGNERPAEFKAGEQGPPNLVVFTRKKEEKKEAK